MKIYDFTIYNLMERNAFIHANKSAWIEAETDKKITFAEYKQKSTVLAAELKKAGLKKGDRIGIIGKNSLEFFLLYGAAAALGAIILPVNWRLSANEICFNFTDCEPKFIFADNEYHGLIDSIKDKLSFVKEYFSLNEASVGYPSIEELLKNINADFTPEDIAGEDGFLIIHTAAIHGRPRGALLTHSNILAGNLNYTSVLHLTSADVHLNFLPLFHIGGLSMAYAAFHAGAANINMAKFNADKAVDIIEKNKVSFAFDFSPILSSVIEAAKKSNKDITSLKAVAGLDSPETIEEYQKLTGGSFYSLYGQTETSCLATFGKYDEKPGAAGKMVPLAEVKIVDDQDNILGINQVGEITVKGPVVFKGYWNLPEDNEFIFRAGMHHTGDTGRFDEEGFLWYAGRKAEKELIKPGGENVYPAEVEKVILQHPNVEKTVVFGVPDPKWKEGVKAVCTLKEGRSLDKEELIKFVGERIASYKKPQYVEFINDMPLNKDESPDREKVKKIYG
ncbi:MAG: AMP-binding protein [Deltaproteobacteria bacterium]|nr:AMP-binding protein [Deltaproteobacteria bacterium]